MLLRCVHTRYLTTRHLTPHGILPHRYYPIRYWLQGYYGYKHSFLWWNFAILIGLSLTFRFTSYLAMGFINWYALSG